MEEERNICQTCPYMICPYLAGGSRGGYFPTRDNEEYDEEDISVIGHGGGGHGGGGHYGHGGGHYGHGGYGHYGHGYYGGYPYYPYPYPYTYPYPRPY